MVIVAMIWQDMSEELVGKRDMVFHKRVDFLGIVEIDH
jgi:hypothetical protein